MPARRIRRSTWKRRVPTCGERHKDIEEVGGLHDWKDERLSLYVRSVIVESAPDG